MKNDPQEQQESPENPRDRLGFLKRTWHRKFNWLAAVKKGARGYVHQSKHVGLFGLRSTKKYANKRQKGLHNRRDRKYSKGGRVNRKMHRRIRNG